MDFPFMSVTAASTDAADPSLRAPNLAASVSLATLAFAVYRFSPHALHLRQLTFGSAGLSGSDVLSIAFGIYLLTLVHYFYRFAPDLPCRALLAWRTIFEFLREPRRLTREGVDPRARQCLLTLLLKMFFAPLMVLFLWAALCKAMDNGLGLWRMLAQGQGSALQLFNAHGFWFVFQLTLLVDVGWFTIGYLVERASLDNLIRSVDPTLAGWLAALACYPPINLVTVRLLGGNVADFPQFASTTVHLVMNALLLLAMMVYAAASVALGWKASNLTHRGIVSRGPYRFIRHPAYTAKNLAWWIGSVPAFTIAWQHSVMQGLSVMGATLAWSGLYVMRALTEEDHLRSVDDEYAKYCEAVRFRFLPRLI